MNKKKVNFVLIPAGMTPICQPLDISINKIFKDNIKFLFEQKRIYFEDLNQKIKLKQARLNLLDFINTVWYNNSIITKNIIINGFNKAGIINKYYTSEEEDKISDLFIQDLIDEKSYEIIDDLSIELNVNMNNLENEE